MAISECNNCGGKFHWLWEEAFDKFGFNDGDGQVETWLVEDALTDAGYEVKVDQWGIHNTIIVSIKKNADEIIPYEDKEVSLGYSCPRNYLPAEIISLLDQEFE